MKRQLNAEADLLPDLLQRLNLCPIGNYGIIAWFTAKKGIIMIKMITAYTEEVDEIEDGLAEILEQIDLGSLQKNSAGLVTCHFDFINSGFIRELCKKLPFNIIGMTTMASGNQHSKSMYAFSLTVLTSDDVVFETAITESLDSGDYQKKIKTAYSDTVKKLPGQPSLILAFFPYIKDVGGALMHKSFDEICGGVPFWGSIATNVDVSFERCSTFHNNEASKNGLALLLLHGQVDPEFIVVSLPAKNIRKNRGLITASQGCILKEISGIKPMKYLENLGVVIMKDAPNVSPLMVYYEGSSEPVALAIYSIEDDGSLVCGGEMVDGASVAIGEITVDGILASTGEGMEKVIKTNKHNGALFLPCVSRYLMLAPNQSDEMELIAEKMENGKKIPFMVGYAGGEFCPVRDEAGILRNRFHNYTFTACVF